MIPLEFRVFKPEHNSDICGIVFKQDMTYCNTFSMLVACTTQNGHDEITRPFYIMQYTGLKDKNGTKIFEGDIIKNGLSGTREMQSCPGGFILYGLTDHYKGNQYSVSALNSEAEVIGNIYENKSLAKGE